LAEPKAEISSLDDTMQSPSVTGKMRVLEETKPGRTAHPMYNVGVYGATGYTGQVLMSILAKHPNVHIAFATSESSRGIIEGVALITSSEVSLDDIDVVFLALPHAASGATAAQAVEAGVRVIDLSADLRLDTPELYKQTYGHNHPAPHLLPAPFGLTEVYRSKLAGAQWIANPGCHVTATLLALYPLAKNQALTGDPIIADTKTGISGAGKALKPEWMFVESYGEVRPYNIGRTHRHVPEIEQELKKWQPDVGMLIFAPHVVPIDVGLLATVYARVKPGWTIGKIREAYEAAYLSEPLIDLLPEGQLASVKMAARKNNTAIAISHAAHNMVILTSAIDNLRKGASSQAVQNFNVMMSLPETAGLL
jgi:N-acetyl-gamma-glutamyl-phosphate reductase